MFEEKPISLRSKRASICGVGINDANYIIGYSYKGVSVKCPYYERWKHIITRCYSEKSLSKRGNYKGCTVCEEWLTFSNFKSWMEKQDWEGKDLDKDLRIVGNKIYSPDTCCFIPQELNKLLTDNKSNKRSTLPTGVYQSTQNTYCARITKDSKSVYIGTFPSVRQAEIGYLEERLKYLECVSYKYTGTPDIMCYLKQHIDLVKTKIN